MGKLVLDVTSYIHVLQCIDSYINIFNDLIGQK